MKKALSILLILCVCILVLSGRAAAQRDEREKVRDTISKSFEVSSGGLLTVDTEEGSIEVRAGESNRVDVEVIREASAWSREEAERILQRLEVRFSQSGNNVRIEGSAPRGRDRKHMEFRVTVPRAFNVDLKTSGGSIEVEGLQGDIRSKTSGGSLRFERIQGPIRGDTSGGSISINDVDGRVVTNTSGGGITVRNVTQDVSLHTSGGSITIENVKARVEASTSGGGLKVEDVSGPIEAVTSGGSVSARFSKQPEGDCRLETSGGNVVVHLAEGVRLNVDAEVSGGEVITDFPVTVQGRMNKSMLKGSINGGGPMLICRTSGSNIYLRKL